MMCTTTVLHGGICHRTSTPHRRGNKMKEKKKKKMIYNYIYACIIGEILVLWDTVLLIQYTSFLDTRYVDKNCNILCNLEENATIKYIFLASHK